MGRHKGPAIRCVSLRLLETTAKQLDNEAAAAGKPLGTYLRDLLQAYAPGTPTLDIKGLAQRLSLSKIKLDGL